MTHDLAYRGVDGMLWHLYGEQEAAENVALLDHAKGLYLPPTELLTTSTAFQVGSTPRKTVEDERLVEMLIGTRGFSQGAHDQTESDWWASWSTQQAGRLEVDGGARWLDVRVRKWPDAEWKIWPDVNNFMSHDMDLVACNPAWQSGVRAKEVTGSGSLAVPVINRTDRPQWLNFVGSAGLWKLPDGLSTRMVDMPPLTQGWKLYTDPQVRTLEVDDGEKLWPGIMKGVTFTKPLPPRMKQPVVIHPHITGTGTIRVEMVDQHSRPWG